jgi:hypothetical protein
MADFSIHPIQITNAASSRHHIRQTNLERLIAENRKRNHEDDKQNQ